MRRVAPFLLSLLLSIAGPAFAASTINSLPPVYPFPLNDPGCPNSSVENLWIANGAGSGADYRITPTQLGYIFQGGVAPLCPFRYQLWWNTAVNPPTLQVYDGSQWLVAGALDYFNHAWVLPSPVFSGTVTGIYTLGGTITITSPTLNNPTIAGTVGGTYTLGGTVTIDSPTIANPTFTGTITGTNVLSLTNLPQIPAFRVLGNATSGTANVTSDYAVSGTAATLASTYSTFLPGDITVAADVNGTVQSSGTFLGGTIFYRFLNPGAVDTLEILNSSSTASTGSQVSLNTGTSNNVALSTLVDAPAAANRKWSMTIGSATGGGIIIDSSGGGIASPLALIGGASPFGITLGGTSEVMYSYSNPGAGTGFLVYNNNTGAGTSAAVTAQTGSGGATINMAMVDGGTPTGTLGTGAGAIGGLALETLNGPISIFPRTASPPQILMLDTNAGGVTLATLENNSSSAGTTAEFQVLTGTANNFLRMTAQEGPNEVVIFSGSGATSGFFIDSAAGPIYITPSTSVAQAAPQTVIQYNNAGGQSQVDIFNNSTSGGTAASLMVATGAQNVVLQSAETSHRISLTSSAGATGGILIDASLSGDVSLTPAAASHIAILNTGSFVAAANCNSLATSTGCLAIKDYNGNIVYLPIYGTI